MPRARIIAVAVVVGLSAAGTWFIFDGPSQETDPAKKLASEKRTFASNDPIERACDLDERQLLRIWRGHHPKHSEDVTIVPQEPNYSGTFGITSHSGPWDYLQFVPLVFYGPNRITAQGKTLEQFANVADVFPTIGELLNVDLPERDGEVLDEAVLGGTAGVPKLVVTIMWDGVGRNVLNQHPGRWPVLARMERQGTSYLGGSVGSSPSITPATHSTLGTGTYPRAHGVTAIELRDDQGVQRGAFEGRDPRDLEVTTYGDEIDRALGNEPKVGMLAWKSWHLGMLGHGTATEGGDADLLGLIGEGEITGNDEFFYTPDYLDRFAGLEEHADELDREDGKADGEWMGHEILAQHDNPAWIEYQTDALLETLKREGFGADRVPDLFFTNFKITDIVGHQYGMDTEEEAVVLEAQDAALGELLRYLDRAVGDYVVVLTADHGHTPSADRSGAWPILQGQLEEDINAEFGPPEGRSLVQATTAVGPFLDKKVMRDLGVTGADVARFLNGYTIADNWNEPELPAGFEDRGDEPVLSAAFSKAQIDDVVECAFGSPSPPPDLEG